MSYIYFTEQEKATANDADIAAYLLSRGEAVKRVGREKVWESPSGKVSINGKQNGAHRFGHTEQRRRIALSADD